MSRTPRHHGGSWTAKTHWQLYGPNFDRGLADFIVKELQPRDLLEFGGGLGYLADYITRQRGLKRSYVIEPHSMEGLYAKADGPTQLAIDIFSQAGALPAQLQESFDLVLSIEVAEHIERERHDQLFDFLVGHANHWIVFSAARPGQGGHGHVAERPVHEWRSELERRGARFDAELTLRIRSACDAKNVNHRRNVMVFRKCPTDAVLEADFPSNAEVD